jgi:hypothetical protein
MTVLLTLLPALCLFGGALLYLLPLRIVSRYRKWIPLLALALSAAALLFLARTAGEPTVLFEPSAILPDLTLSLQWGGAALPLGLLLLLMMAARLLTRIEDDPRAFVAGALAVSGGALLFLAADNFITLTAAWILVELGLLIVPDSDFETRARVTTAFGWNLVAIMLWMGAAMMLSNQGASLRLQEVALADLPALLVWLSVWIRSGLYPLHAAAPGDVSGAAVRIGVPLLLGGYLLTRVLATSQGPMAFANAMQILVVLAVTFSAVLVASQPHGADVFLWLLRAFGATVLLLPFLGSGQAMAALSVWWTVGAFALCVWVSMAWGWRAQLPQVPLPALVWIGVLVLAAAIPLAPAFWGRVGLLSLGYARGLAWWLLLVAGAGLYLIPIWREIFASRDVAPKEPSRFEYAALAAGLLGALAVTSVPGFFMAPFGTSVQQSADATYNLLFKPTNTAVLIFAVAGLVVPLLFSFELARRWAPRANFFPTRLTTILDLSGLANGLDFVYRFVRALIQQSLALLEQPPIAWLIFLAIWTAVWIIGLGR